MTKPLLKFSWWEALLNSQDIERHQARNEREIADELCDHINASIQWIEDMGFDALDVYEKRVDEKAPDFARIVQKYKAKLGEAIERAKESDPHP